MNRQIYKMTLSDASDSITFYLLEVPIADDDITGTARNTTIDGNVYEDYLWLKKQWSQKWSIMCKDEYDKLRGIWKRQYTDSEVVSVKYFYGDNIYTDGEVEGNTMQINNDSEVYEGEIRGFSLYGNATQKTLSGKNLMPVVPKTSPSQGITATYDTSTGNITLSGTATTVYSIPFQTTDVHLPAGTYVIKQFGTLTHGRIGINLRRSDNTQIAEYTVNSSNLQYTFTLSEDAEKVYLYTGGHSANETVSGTIQVMLVAGTTAGDFEQYCGGVPSPNPDYPQSVETVSGEQTVKITGKNLLGLTDGTYGNNGITATVADGIITLTGTATNTSFINIPLLSNIDLQSTWSISLNNTAYGDASTSTRLYRTDGTTYVQTATNTANAKNENKSDKGIFNILQIRTSSGVVAGGATIEPQVELGSTATDFEPYQAQSYEINLGKNLFDKTDITQGYRLDGSGQLYADATYNVSGYIPIYPNTDYTYSYDPTLLVSSSNAVCFYDHEKNFISRIVPITTSSTTVAHMVSPSNAWFVRIADFDNRKNTMQFEAGTQASPYSPYKTPIELAKIGTYQDYIWNDDGTWKIHKEVGKKVFDGSDDENWTNPNINQLRYPFGTLADDKAITATSIIGIMCDTFTLSASSEAGIAEQYQFTFRGTNYNNGLWFFCPKSAIAGSTSPEILASFKTYLSTHNTTVYYALATPTDTEITDAELVGQLDALLAGSLYKGTNNIFLIPSAGADGTMTLDYRINYEKETVVQDTTPVLLDLTDDGIINACQCRQNVKITMRETVQ